MREDELSFGPVKKARFLERPNRFLVRCRLGARRVVEAFLPNPGRLWELLPPGAVLYLKAETRAHRRVSDRRTLYTVLAVEREGEPVFLETHLTNRVVRFLIEKRRIPPLADARVIRSEVPVGRSRFDFLIERDGRETYLEVKSCTLFGNRVAMFPDAVTERGRGHLIELASQARRGSRPVVLFLVHTPRARWFMPDYHTDLAFSQTLLEVRRKLDILPVAVQWKPDLSLARKVRILEIPWSYLRRVVQDRGSYLLLLRLDRTRRVETGRMGARTFPRGYYLYVGSAIRNLSARIARHSRIRKKLHWHIDFLRLHADGFVALPIRSPRRSECEIARAFSELYRRGPDGFGASDCDCPAHLFWHSANPLDSPSFHAVLQRFRMAPP
ncbi:MAG: DNA/RNA nuclease SfsA [Acidobacteriota bacterium]